MTSTTTDILQRDMAVGNDPSVEELRAMVFSKKNEPKNTGFDDPQEWSDADMKEFLTAVSPVKSSIGSTELTRVE